MRLIADIDTELWLQTEWDGTLEWDDANVRKLKKHNLSVSQFETLFDEDFVFAGRVVPTDGIEWGEERLVLYGKTDSGKCLTIIWTKRRQQLRPISCRSMRHDEKQTYQSRKNR